MVFFIVNAIVSGYLVFHFYYDGFQTGTVKKEFVISSDGNSSVEREERENEGNMVRFKKKKKNVHSARSHVVRSSTSRFVCVSVVCTIMVGWLYACAQP